MADWLWERLGSWTRRAAAAALVAGGRPVPRHVAFIMDGNRRFAEARSLRKVDGHSFGYRRLIDALEWCLELGVRCVSVYAFSIDNYRRSSEEVATLMQLAQEKLAHMLQEHDVLARHGVQVRVIGDLSLAPPAVQAAAAAVMAATAHHDRAVLNLCFSYSASEELLHALDCLEATASCVSAGSSANLPAARANDAAPEAAAVGGAAGIHGSPGSLQGSPAPPALERHLYTAECPPVDLLVRTSGETRLSDFLLWQSRHALLAFTPVLWPDFGFLDLVAAVMQFQRHCAHLQRLRTAVAEQQAAAAAAAAAGSALAGASARGLPQQLPQWPGFQQQAKEVQQAQQQQQPQHQGLQQEQQQGRHLRPMKVAIRELQQQGSPCYVASPASPSSPSSRSEASAEEITGPEAEAAAPGPGRSPAALRKRHAVAAAAAGAVL
ncbi:hypothetical protein ABPG77_002292 [Micractinium sp. CCAP 211/92]